MSSLLLGPTARRAILARTYVNPAAEYHLRELVRLTGLAPRSIQQEVDQLVRAGFLRERRSGNRRYLQANESHPLFRPVQEIVLKTDGLAEVLKDALAGAEVDLALVYGSVAAGSPTAASDVDVLIVGSVSSREVAGRLRRAQDVLGREIVPVVWTSEEYRARKRRRDAFLSRLLKAPVIQVVGDLSRRAG